MKTKVPKKVKIKVKKEEGEEKGQGRRPFGIWNFPGSENAGMEIRSEIQKRFMPSEIFELQGEKMGACCRVAEVMVKKKKSIWRVMESLMKWRIKRKV